MSVTLAVWCAAVLECRLECSASGVLPAGRAARHRACRRALLGTHPPLLAARSLAHGPAPPQSARPSPLIRFALCPSPVQVLQDMQEDPAAAQQHMRHPDISRKIEKLVAAGILQIR